MLPLAPCRTAYTSLRLPLGKALNICMNLSPWYKQVIFALIPFLVASAIFPIVSWFIVIDIFHGIELAIGYHAPLVGEPGGIDPGAVLVTLIYGALSLFIVVRLAKSRYFIAAYSIGISSVALLIYVFSVVSSLIWF